ncbi:MAG: peptide ABC transporter substrate-binding protein, partial [Chloroflexota bacterium]|nr:peptide ABC transporter substrate-binding protein [Chloroflexota bacterium]
LDVLFHSMSGDNTGDYSNSRVDTLLKEAREESDATTRLSLYREIEQLIIDDAACLPLFFDVSYTLVKPYVKGFAATPLPIPWLKYVSIEPHE